MYELCTQKLMAEITSLADSGNTLYAKEKEALKGTAKKTFKQLLFDFTIETKKNIPHESNHAAMLSGPVEVSPKMKSLVGVFQNPWLEKLFTSTKKSLARNSKIAKINET